MKKLTLTKRQKIILLVATCFLSVVVITSTVLIAKSGKETKSLEQPNTNPKKPSAPPSDKNPEPEDNIQTLEQERGKALTLLEEKINTEKVKDSDLLSELK